MSITSNTKAEIATGHSPIAPPIAPTILHGELRRVLIYNQHMKKNILLHICCAPDGCVPVPDLINEGWNVIGFFYGSNIHPYDEYVKRLEAVNRLISHNAVKCEIPCYTPDEWLKNVKGLEEEPEGGKRCTECFRTQLEAGAKAAKALGCEYMSTTLTISPHKNVKLLNELGEAISASHSLKRTRTLPAELLRLRLQREAIFLIISAKFSGLSFSLKIKDFFDSFTNSAAFLA